MCSSSTWRGVCIALISMAASALTVGCRSNEVAKPSGDVQALVPFMRSMTLSGRVLAGQMEPGAPEQASKGKWSCSALWGGVAYQCDIEDGPASGKGTPWIARLLLAHDSINARLSGALVDNNGGVMQFVASIEGAKITFTGTNEVANSNGKPSFYDRFSFDLDKWKFTDERRVGDGPWTLFEEGELKLAE